MKVDDHLYAVRFVETVDLEGLDIFVSNNNELLLLPCHKNCLSITSTSTPFGQYLHFLMRVAP